MAATTGILLSMGIGSSFVWSEHIQTPRLFRLLVKHCGKVSPRKTSCRRLHICAERDEPVLSALMGWHGCFNWLQNYASGTIRKLETWRLICIPLRQSYSSG